MTQPALSPKDDEDDLPELRVAIEVEIPSDVRYIERVVELVTKHCEEFHFSARHCSLNIPVALSEAISNAILRGNRESREKHVRVKVNFETSALVVEVTDEGDGFDIDRCIVDPTNPENLLREDGRGLFLMRRLMDRVEMINGAGGGVRLTLQRP